MLMLHHYGFLCILLSSLTQACPEIMQEGWKQLPLAERARRVDVVAVGKAVEVHDDPDLPKDFKIGGFHLTTVLKGHRIVEMIYAYRTRSIFYIIGFGNPSLCYTHLVKDETYLLFAKFVPETTALHVPFQIPFGGTAEPSIQNQDEILSSLGEYHLIPY